MPPLWSKRDDEDMQVNIFQLLRPGIAEEPLIKLAVSPPDFEQLSEFEIKGLTQLAVYTLCQPYFKHNIEAKDSSNNPE